MNVNFEEVIINAIIKNKFTGRIIFLGPQGGIVRNSSPKELERIKEWKEGRILLKVSKLSKRN
jgi:hypothetical protein